MEDYFNVDKNTKLKNVLTKLSNTNFHLFPQISAICSELEDIYWQGAKNNLYRHMYSEIFTVLTEIDKNTKCDINILSQNLRYVCERYKPKNKDINGNSIDISSSLMKLYDHVNLDAARLNYTKGINYENQGEIAKVTSNIRNIEHRLNIALEQSIYEMEQKQKEFSKQVNDTVDKTKETSNKLRSEYITILGIFASIVLAFTAGMAYSTSVFSNIHKASIYRVVLITLLVGLILIFVLWMLMDFIKSIHDPSSKRRWYMLAVPIAVVVIGILITFVAYYHNALPLEQSITDGIIEKNETCTVYDDN